MAGDSADAGGPGARLAGRFVLVTGACGGIGSAFCRAAAREGATLVLLDRNQRALDTLYDQLAATGAEPVQVHEDLATLDIGRANVLAGQVDAAFGCLHALVHLAQEPAPLSPLDHFPPESWLKLMHAQVNASWLLYRALSPLLQAAEAPRVILASGDAGRQPRAYHGATALAWSAVDTLAGILAEECEGRDDFRVFSVDPGPVQSDMRVRWHPGEPPDTAPTADAVAEALVRLAAPADPGLDAVLGEIRDGELRAYTR